MKKIILASSSPRRRELLKQVGIDFDIVTSGCDEHVNADTPAELVSELSRIKCMDVCSRLDDGNDHIVIGADTIVVYDGNVLGKPSGPEDAFRMLKSLAGRTHQVYTGVTLAKTGNDKESLTFYEVTDVTMFSLSDSMLREYVETGEPLDKAGAYGIQGTGAILVEKISGDYNNVVGLPLARLFHILKSFMN